ncbi:hypothetical protein J7J59_02510 [Candidatus Aerophobetes bacterium]|nr:hypothetical protein [Candidatus Aerophobetes bacterium]
MRAYETELTFGGEKGHAVVVEFEKPWRLVSWSKYQYIVNWDLGGGVWFTPEWLETHSPDDGFCYEPLMDKELRYSRVRILEAGPVRAKIHWHYALCNPRYEIFNGNSTADEYYTVYPDGIAVRKLVGWPGNESEFGGNSHFWEVMEFILKTGGIPIEDVINKKECFSFQSEKGEKLSFPWPIPKPFAWGQEPLCNSYPQVKDWKFYIGRIYLKDRPDPFCMFVKDKRIFPYKPCSSTSYGSCNGDHPPLTLWDIGRRSTWEGGTSASFLSCQAIRHPGEKPPRPCVWLFLTGATEQDDAYLIDLGQSWYNPAYIIGPPPVTAGYGDEPVYYEGYSFSERAYQFRKMKGEKVSFLMMPSMDVINPVIRVSGWKTPSVSVSFDSYPLDTKDFQAQLKGDELLLWINKRVSKNTKVEIVEKGR